MKNTKLFLGVLIAALVLGFASCKQEAQDVNVIGNTVKTDTTFYYSVSGTYKSNSSATAEDVSGYADISWSSGNITNGTKYTIKYTINHKLSTATTWTSESEATLTLYKIGSKYYKEDVDSNSQKIMNDVTSRVTGSIDGKFTYTLEATSTDAGYALTFQKR